jgi:hypothetical protein
MAAMIGKKKLAPPIRTDQELPGILSQRAEMLRIHFNLWKDIPAHPYAKSDAKLKKKKSTLRPKRGGKAVESSLHEVVAAVLEGRWYKISGHARTEQWLSGELDLPKDKTLNVRAYQAMSVEDLDRLYHVYDMSDIERPNETIYRVIQSGGIRVKSKNIRFGFFGGALNYAIRGCSRPHQPENTMEIALDQALTVYRSEVEEIDRLDIKAEVFSTGVLAAAMVSLALHPESITVWHRLNAGEWQHNKSAPGYDAAGIINRLLIQRRGNERVTRSPVGHQFMFRFCLAVIEEWVRQKENNPDAEPSFRSMPKPIGDPLALVDRVREVKGLGYEPQLFERPPKRNPRFKPHPDDQQLLDTSTSGSLFLNYSQKSLPSRREPDNLWVINALSYAMTGKADSACKEKVDLRVAVRQYQKILKQLDALKLAPEIFTPGVLGAALASVRMDPACLPIWARLNDGSWTRTSEGTFDAAGIINHLLVQNHKQQRRPTLAWSQRAFEASMMAIKAWERVANRDPDGKQFKAIPRPLTNAPEWIESVIMRKAS